LRTATILLTLATAAVACTQRLPDPVPIAEPGELAERLRKAGTPVEPQLIEFKWRYRGREGRFSGEGAVRVNPPDSVRLDLFGPDWSGVQSAVLLGDQVYYLGEQRIELPPPTFMWTMLGAFRPPAGVAPRANQRGEWSELIYDLPSRRSVVFRFDSVGALVEAELEIEGDAVQRIRVEPGDPGIGPSSYTWPKEARYRDLAEYHEVSIDVTEIREHAPFESRIFDVAPG
jgi:hypothetical protein